MGRFPLSEKARFGFALVGALAAARRAGPSRQWTIPTPETRAGGLLSLVEREVWPRDDHPYRRLLAIAGWSPERLRRSVTEAGLEPTLEQLADSGVYLRSDEIKTRTPLVRRGIEIRFSPVDLERVTGPAVPLGSSGTTGPVTKNPFDVPAFQLQASYLSIMVEAFGASGLPVVLYYPAPSAPGIVQTVAFALAGMPVAAWFCHLPERSSAQAQWGLWLRLLAAAARLRGVRLPLPRTAPVDRPSLLARWLAEQAPNGAMVLTFPGSALRVVAHADALGLRLPALVWVLGGEPMTPRKRMLLEQSGHRVFPWYGAVDAGRIAIGCASPQGADDMHLLGDRFAAIVPRQPPAVAGRLLLTAIAPGVHKLLLNADIGDTAQAAGAGCGCPLERQGLEMRLRRVRSVEKLTLEGITLPADVVNDIAEEVLPARCGGSPGDYQMSECEGDDGRTRLLIRVRPGIAVEERDVVEAVEKILVDAVDGFSDMGDLLHRGTSIEVRREPPVWSAGGKLLSLGRGPERTR